MLHSGPIQTPPKPQPAVLATPVVTEMPELGSWWVSINNPDLFAEVNGEGQDGPYRTVKFAMYARPWEHGLLFSLKEVFSCHLSTLFYQRWRRVNNQ
jgi:hypothetical protein